jgi:hypothetical protein
MENIHAYLGDLEERLDPASEEKLLDDWICFANNQWKHQYFKPARTKRSRSKFEWPEVRYNDAFHDYDLMAYRELCGMNRQLSCGGPELLSYRANYGTVILPSLFGAVPVLMPYEQNSLPVSRPLDNAKESFRRLLLTGRKIKVRGGYPLKSFEAAARFKDLLKGYPKLSRYCYIYMADTESPVSILEALFGTDFYFLFSDEPKRVHDCLYLITEVFLDFVREWHKDFPPVGKLYRNNWGFLHRGHALIREDAATNISGDLYREFVFPYDKRIMESLGGGAIHFCGKGDHLIQHFAELPGFYSLNMSQPDLNDMNKIYDYTIRRGVTIIGLANAEVNRCLREGIDLLGRVEAGLGIPAWMKETEELLDAGGIEAEAKN